MFPINDWFDAVLVGAFLFGLLFTVASVVLGFGDLGADSGHDVDHGADINGHFLQLFNVSSIVAFVTWFSGATYLARNGFGWFVGVAMALGLVVGLAGAWSISWFLYSFLRKNSPELNPADWDQIGQIGRVTSTILPNGVGEVMYERHGTRHAIPAATSDGRMLNRDTEVVIMHITKGIAVVQPWTELMDEDVFEQDIRR